jgi:hypothetical protein
MALILSLCVLTLAVPWLASGPGELVFSGPDHHPAEINALDPCVDVAFDSYSAIADRPLTEPIELIGPRPLETQFLALGPALRPIVPPPETASPARAV